MGAVPRTTEPSGPTQDLPMVFIRGKSRIDVDLQSQSAEARPFAAERFDCVVCTWTLCSIPDVPAALAEVIRVLKPGGRFVFLVHGLSDEPGIQRWQQRLNPIQRRIGAGCQNAEDTRIDV
jgi:ubiquinone/menaquinone biosynthesis C-methylase UbiE